MATVSVMSGLTVACLWTASIVTDPTRVSSFALAYGLFSGAYVSLMMPCAAKSGSPDTLGQRFGTFQSVIAIA